MIIIILGGIGSGKTLTAVKEIATKKQYAITNFSVNIPNTKRLKFSDIIVKGDKKEKIKDRVNWEYWDNIRKQEDFSIYLDEVHNVVSSRRAMSGTNILMSRWLSQIRKILSDNPTNHLYLISQTIRKIDVDFRELAQIIVQCSLKKIGKDVYIVQHWFNGIDNYEIGRHKFKTVFKGNPYFRFYDTRSLVTFSDAEEYV